MTRSPTVAGWPATASSTPGMTLEEIVRPFGHRTTVTFRTGPDERAVVTYDTLARCGR
jgi:hypothetical protein